MGWILKLRLDTATLDLVSAQLWDAGTTGIAQLDDDQAGETLLAGFETDREASAAGDRVQRSDPSVVVVSIEPATEAAWADPDRRLIETVAGHDIELAPGAAFGDGGHPTTRLALDLLAANAAEQTTIVATEQTADDAASRVAPADLGAVLDFGSGTGILALAALAHGARAVMAVENDPAAVDALQATLALNPRLTEGRSVEVSTALAQSPGAEGRSRFDVALVNVLLPVHQAWGAAIARRRADDGVVVISGVLAEQEDDLLACYPDLAVRRRRLDGDWLGLVLGSGERR